MLIGRRSISPAKSQASSVYGLQPKMAISQLKTGAMPQPMVRMAFGQKTIPKKSTALQAECRKQSPSQLELSVLCSGVCRPKRVW
ncbi:hypothetical protein CGZ80_16225 [Rhodopirellula sp. MGV]|nr:hypothetical protein CGZ80_16225 [Rhodopirellula sp. MGV]PNY33629.1 hypothetical protein C2E31_27945 [Rhodopirellula baltica]